jgi:hypothetical protein
LKPIKLPCNNCKTHQMWLTCLYHQICVWNRCIGQNWGEFEGNVLMFRYIIMRERRLELWGCSVISNEKKLSWNIIPNLRSKFSVWKGLTHTHCDRIVKWRRLYTWNQCWDSSHEAEQMSPAAYTSAFKFTPILTYAPVSNTNLMV